MEDDNVDAGRNTYDEHFANFAAKHPEFAREYVWRLVDKMNERDSLTARDFTSITGLALIFELLNRRAISNVSIAGFGADRLDFLRYLVPILFGYLHYRAMAALRDRIIMQRVYYRLSEKIFTDLHKSQMDRLLRNNPVLIGAYAYPDYVVGQRAGIWISRHRAAETTLLVLVLPLLFSGYALIQLFNPAGFGSLATWICIFVVTVGFLFMSLTTITGLADGYEQ